MQSALTPPADAATIEPRQTPAPSSGTASKETRRTTAPATPPASKPLAETPKGSGNQAAITQNPRPISASTGQAQQGHGTHRSTSKPEAAGTPSPGAAGRAARPGNNPYPVTTPDMAGTRQASSAASSSKRIGKVGNASKKAKEKGLKKFRKGKGT